MLSAPAVVCEISAPPTTPRGTSRSGPGLTTFMPRTLPAAGRPPQRAADLEVELRRVAKVVDVDALVVAVHAGRRDLDRGRARGPYPVGGRSEGRSQVVRVGEAGADGRQQDGPGIVGF